MDPTIPILGLGTFLVASTAAWFMARKTQRDKDPEIAYRRAMDGLESAKAARREAFDKTKGLNKHLKVLMRKEDSLRQRLKKNADDEKLQREWLSVKESIKQLEHEAGAREKEIVRLEVLLSTFEIEIQSLITKMMVSYSKTKSNSSMNASTKLLKSLERRHGVFEKFEKSVKRKETGVFEMVSKLETKGGRGSLMAVENALGKMEKHVQFRESKLNAAIVSDNIESNLRHFDSMCIGLAHIRCGVVSAYDAAKTFFAAADPSVEAAFKRLCEQVESAENLAAASLQEESEFEQRIAAAESANNRDEFEIALKLHRRKNISIRNALFHVDDVVRRLKILQLLFSAHPDLRDKHCNEYKQVVLSLCECMGSAMQSKEQSSKEQFVDIPSRVSSMETSALQAYLDLVKNSSEKLTDSSFQADLRRVHSTFSAEVPTATAEIERWNNAAHQAQLEKWQLLELVAAQRVDAWTNYRSVLQLTLDVIELFVGDEQHTDATG